MACNITSIPAIWWRHQMKFSALSALCGFPSQRPVTRSFDVYLICVLTNGGKQSRRWWFKTSSRSSWYHCNGSNPEENGNLRRYETTTSKTNTEQYGYFWDVVYNTTRLYMVTYGWITFRSHSGSTAFIASFEINPRISNAFTRIGFILIEIPSNLTT